VSIRVGFYVVSAAGAQARLDTAARLSGKAFAQGLRVFIHCADEAQAQVMDELLWSYRPDSFLPHGLLGSGDEQQIGIGWGQPPGDHDGLLLNLSLQPPSFYTRFARVAEVVTQDPQSLQALRAAWRFYQAAGCTMEKHDL